MPSTVLVSTDAAGRPAAAASFMHNASLKTTPSKRSTAGFRMCVLGAPPKRKGDFAAFDAHGDFVLRAGERKADSLLAREQRTFGQFLQDCGEFL